LEIGPGGGYNSLATYTFNRSKYVLIEPNPYGFKELIENFQIRGYDNNVDFHNCLLEEFESDEKFDIVICEGLIQGLSNRKTFLNILSNNFNVCSFISSSSSTYKSVIVFNFFVSRLII